MTVNSTKNKIEYVGDGVSKDFPLPFKFFRDSHIKAYLTRSGSEQEIFTAFTVDGADNENGGTAHTNAPLPVDCKILFYRELDLTQEDDFKDNNPGFAETMEKNSDKTIMKLQQLQEIVNRCAKVPITSPDNPEDLLADSIAQCALSEQNAAESASTATTQAEMATEQAGIATAAAQFANDVVNGFDTHAAQKQAEINASAAAAANSATAAKNSEINAAASETAALVSQTAAASSENNAAASKMAAKESETNAKTSETASRSSEINAATSEINAKASETNAKTSETAAAGSALSAATSASEAERFRNEAEEIANLPEMSETVKGATMAAVQEEVNAGVIDNKAVTPKKLKAFSSLHIENTENPHQVTAVQVGLGNVDNTSDLDKPVSAATQTALNTKLDKTDICPQPSGVDIVELDTAVIPVQDKVCWYRRVITANDSFTIDLSARTQTTPGIIIDLIISNPSALPFDLSQILPLETGDTADDNKTWLGKSTPDLSEAGEHWVALFTMNAGQTWRASYEGVFKL